MLDSNATTGRPTRTEHTMRGGGLLAGVIGTCLMVGTCGTSTAATPIIGPAASGTIDAGDSGRAPGASSLDSALPAGTVLITPPRRTVAPLCLACLLPF